MAYSKAYAPSAPELPESFGQQLNEEGRYSYAYPYGVSGQPAQKFGSSGMFSPETHPDIVRSFESADRDRGGFLDESGLRQALSFFSGYDGISHRTIRVLVFIYKSPGDPLLRLGNNFIYVPSLLLNLIFEHGFDGTIENFDSLQIINIQSCRFEKLATFLHFLQVLRSMLSCGIALHSGV